MLNKICVKQNLCKAKFCLKGVCVKQVPLYWLEMRWVLLDLLCVRVWCVYLRILIDGLFEGSGCFGFIGSVVCACLMCLCACILIDGLFGGSGCFAGRGVAEQQAVHFHHHSKGVHEPALVSQQPHLPFGLVVYVASSSHLLWLELLSLVTRVIWHFGWWCDECIGWIKDSE